MALVQIVFCHVTAKKTGIRAIMVKEKKFASKKKIHKELEKLDITSLLKKLEDYATYLLYDHNRDRALDISIQAFEKIISQERKWYDGNSFISTIFLVVKSLSNNENKKLQKRRESEVDEIDYESVSSPTQQDQFEELNLAELKSIAMEALKSNEPPPDYLEELIFECWIEGLKKQQEIANYLEKDIIEIRKGVKRLNRKIGSVRDKLINMGYERK